MSDQKILQLQSETGCDFDLAKLMLKFTGDDIEGAVKIISSVEKNIYVIRGKFIAQTNKIYGAFIFFYDVKNKSIEKVNAVIRDNDKSAIEFDFEKRWKEYQEDLLNYEKSRGINLNLQNNFYTGLINSKSVHFFERLSKNKEIDEQSLKNFLTEIIIGVVGDVNTAIKIKVNKTDAFEMNKGDKIPDDDKTGTSENKKTEKEKIELEKNQILTIKIELDISPVEGTPISELKPGQTIAVKITDDRAVASYINNLLSGTTSFDEYEPQIIYAELEDLVVTDGGIRVKVRFGPGIYGVAFYGENVKVRTAAKEEIDAPERAQKGNFFSKNFWIIGIILIAVVLVLLFLLIQTD